MLATETSNLKLISNQNMKYRITLMKIRVEIKVLFDYDEFSLNKNERLAFSKSFDYLLYKLLFEVDEVTIHMMREINLVLCTDDVNTANLWHSRMEHLGYKNSNKLFRKIW